MGNCNRKQSNSTAGHARRDKSAGMPINYKKLNNCWIVFQELFGEYHEKRDTDL